MLLHVGFKWPTYILFKCSNIDSLITITGRGKLTLYIGEFGNSTSECIVGKNRQKGAGYIIEQYPHQPIDGNANELGLIE